MIQASQLIAAGQLDAEINRRTWGDIYINVKVYGAKGDGITDDTEAIQSAVNYCIQQVKATNFLSRVSILFPAGIYKITGITSKVFVKFISQGHVKFVYTGSGTAITIDNDTDTPSYFREMYCRGEIFTGGFVIEKLNSDKIGTALKLGNFSSVAIGVKTFGRASMEQIGITGFNTAIDVGNWNTYLLSFNGMHIENNTYAIRYADNTANNSGERMNFTDCIFAGSDCVMFNQVASFMTTFTNCSFDFNVDIVQVKRGYNYIKFDNCYFENVTGYLVNSITTAPLQLGRNSNIYFIGCWMWPGSCKPYITGDYIDVYFSEFDIRYFAPEVDRTNTNKMTIINDSAFNSLSVNNIAFTRSYGQCISKKTNVCYNGDFELCVTGQDLGAGTVNGFTLLSKGSVVTATIVDTKYFSGGKSLKVSAAGSSNTFCNFLTSAINSQAGDVFVGSYRYALTTTTESAQKQYFIAYDKDGNILSQQSPYGENDVIDVTGNWKYCPFIFPFRCPPNTAYVKFVVSLSNWYAGDIYIDDVIINKIG